MLKKMPALFIWAYSQLYMQVGESCQGPHKRYFSTKTGCSQDFQKGGYTDVCMAVCMHDFISMQEMSDVHVCMILGRLGACSLLKQFLCSEIAYFGAEAEPQQLSCLHSIACSYCMHFFSGILYMYEHLQLKPADIKSLRENMVSRTASVVTNGPGCSEALLLAETHLKDKISSA